MVCADAADMVVCIACFDLSITPLLFWWLVESKEIILTDVCICAVRERSEWNSESEQGRSLAFTPEFDWREKLNTLLLYFALLHTIGVYTLTPQGESLHHSRRSAGALTAMHPDGAGGGEDVNVGSLLSGCVYVF